MGVIRQLRHRTARGLEMRIALVGVTGEEPELLTWAQSLERAGLPAAAFGLGDGRQAGLLLAELRQARFQALILAHANVLRAALDGAAARELVRIERQFQLRRLVACAYPSADNGLAPAPWSGTLDGAVGSLTPRGREVFPYLGSALRFDAGSWAHPGRPLASARFQTLISAADGAVLIGIHQLADGREEMVQTFASGPLQSHTHLLRPGQLLWLTRGVHLGLERHYLSLHVDDVLLPNPSWDTATHRSDARTSTRMSAADAAHSASWSRERRLRLDLACNGGGTNRYLAEQAAAHDPLLEALLAERAAFGWINHTYEHRTFDDAPQAAIEAEIDHNARWARGAGIEFEPAALITGGHTGLGDLAVTPPRMENPALGAGLAAQGIRFLACDASRAYQTRAGRPVTPGAAFAVGDALVIPRHPINLPFDAATAAQVLDQLGGGRPGGPPGTWPAFVAAEAERILRLVVGNDPRPHYVHQSNLVRDADGRVLLHDVIDAVVGRYQALVSGMGIEQPRFEEIGRLLLTLAEWRAAVAGGVITARVAPGRVTIENRGSLPIAVPLTGAGSGRRYGPARSGWCEAQPGSTVIMVDAGAPVAEAAVAAGAG